MEEVFYEKIQEKNVFCHFSSADATIKKIVIMSHGFRGANVGPAREFVDFQRILNEAGYSVLRFDQPHCGNSDGDYLDVSFTEWVETIVYFAQKYLALGYEVNLFGQSMGATATVIATHHPALVGKIPCILLWVPDSKTTTQARSTEIYEEMGQKYRGSFWVEAAQANFPECLKKYGGKIHLVYGEFDKYVEPDLKKLTIEIVEGKHQPVMILPGQDHSPWDFALAQDVYGQQLARLKEK